MQNPSNLEKLKKLIEILPEENQKLANKCIADKDFGRLNNLVTKVLMRGVSSFVEDASTGKTLYSDEHINKLKELVDLSLRMYYQADPQEFMNGKEYDDVI